MLPPPPPPGSPPPNVVEYNIIETPVPKSVRFVVDETPNIHKPPPGDSSEDEGEEGSKQVESDKEKNDDREEEGLEKEKMKDKDKTLDDAKIQLLPPRPPGSHIPSVSSLPPPAPPGPPPLFPQTFTPSRYPFPPGPPVGPPPGPPVGPPLRYDGPPPRPLMPPQIQSGAVVSAPPTRLQQGIGARISSGTRGVGSGGGHSAIISAQPQLRNMTAEVTKFMPTSLRVRRDQPKSAKPKLKVNSSQEVSHQPSSGRTQPAAGMHVQGDAYDSFMHEMQGLL